MSDWEDQDMYDEEEEEDLSFEEDEDDEEEHEEQSGEDESIESKYYWGKELRQDERNEEALKVFNEIIELRNSANEKVSKSPYIFKSIKQCMKTCYDIRNYKQLLELLNLFFEVLPFVNKSYGDSSLSKILVRYDKDGSNEFLCSFYDMIVYYLETSVEMPSGSQNERLWIRANLRKANILVEEKKLDSALSILKNTEVKLVNSSESIKNTFLLEVLATRMLIVNESCFNLAEMKELTTKASLAISGVPQPHLIGIIKECSATVAMHLHDFKKANVYFQESFKGFNEAGDDRRLPTLIKLMISNLLSESEINPMESHEFQVYLQNEDISEFLKIYTSAANLNITKYYQLTKRDPKIMQLIESNYFVKTFLPFVTKQLQAKFVCKYIKPFKSLTFDNLSKKLEITIDELEILLLNLYSKGKLSNVKLDLENMIILKSNIVEENKDKKMDEMEFVDFIQVLKTETQSSRHSVTIGTENALSLMSSFTNNMVGQNDSNLPNDRRGISHFKNSINSNSGVIEAMLFKSKWLKSLLKPYLGDVSQFCMNREETKTRVFDYLSRMRTALPAIQDNALTQVEKIEKDNLEREKNELQLSIKKLKQGGVTDDLIPEVIQNTTMAALDLSHEEESQSAPVTERDLTASVAGITDICYEYEANVMSKVFNLSNKTLLSNEYEYYSGGDRQDLSID